MLASKQQTDMPCDQLTITSTAHLSSNFIDNSIDSFRSLENFRESKLCPNNFSEDHIHSKENSNCMPNKEQLVTTVVVDSARPNENYSEARDTTMGSHKTHPGKFLNRAPLHGSKGGSSHELNDLLPSRYGKESIELLASSSGLSYNCLLYTSDAADE